ncbi:hypothetical protein O4H49_05005 [Kiloniella laminariae]|uniref:Uncharacterized protein n=1 Tax=Kiloniella laminariae TaxID=454162 RepID=A0ABT4LJF0_9PROT|nr:hypothetical protein [Kiloniella laminariae]MCZ4280122.1 hypothetical protein [Kiloniella laminariae]
MQQGAIKQSMDLEAALRHEPSEHLSLVQEPNNKWDILHKQANRLFHYRLTEHSLSQQDREALMLARNEIHHLASSLKASDALRKALKKS